MFGISPMGKAPGREMVGIEFNANIVRIAHLKFIANKWEIANLVSRSTGSAGDQDVSKILREVFGELKIKCFEVVDIIPSSLVITKNIEIPSVDPHEIKEIINLQAGRHTPYARDEIIMDYIDIGTHKHSYSKILLVIVARSAIKRQYEILEASGLKLQKVSLAPEGMAWFVSKVLKIDTEHLPVNAIHVDEDSTDFTIIHKDKLIFVRSIPIGAKHLVDEREAHELKFVEELKRSLESYQSEDIERSPLAAVLTGAVGELGYLEANLSETLRMPVKTIPYFKNLPISFDAAKQASAAKRSSFLNVIASLLGRDKMKVDLTPEETKLKKIFEQRSKELIKTGILILTIFVLTFSVLISKIYFKGAYLKALDKRYKPLGVEAQKLEASYNRVIMTRGYLSRRGYSLEVLTELYNKTPTELEFSGIRFDDEQAKFSLRGTADTMSTVFSLADVLKKSKYFKDVKTKYTSRRKEGLKDVTDFEIGCVLNKEIKR